MIIRTLFRVESRLGVSRAKHTSTSVPTQKRVDLSSNSISSGQKFSDFLVVDFEATCNRIGRPPRPQEIIDLPAIRLSAKSFTEVARFHTYVRPTVHPELSDFCTELTGICQGLVDNAPDLKTALDSFGNWMRDNELDENNCSVITYGDWDIQSALYEQCTYLNIDVPPIFRRWINLKKSLMDLNNNWPGSLPKSLKEAGLEFKGRHHSGIDDCVNIANLVQHMAKRGFVFTPTTDLNRYLSTDARDRSVADNATQK